MLRLYLPGQIYEVEEIVQTVERLRNQVFPKPVIRRKLPVTMTRRAGLKSRTG
jgi:hypothetical protein